MRIALKTAAALCAALCVGLTHIQSIPNVFVSVSAEESPKYVSPAEIDESNPYIIYAAPNGNGNGSIEHPIGSIAQAVAKARAVPKDGRYSCIKIVLRGGNYKCTEPVVMTAKDSGTAETPIVFEAYENEKPMFIGCETVDVTKAEKVKDKNVLTQIPKEVRNEIYKIDLGKQGIYGIGYVPQIYYGVKKYKPQAKLMWNGGEMVCARWPNGDEFAKVGTVYYSGVEWFNKNLQGKQSDGIPDLSNEPGFVFKSDAPGVSKWADAKDAWLYGYWRYGWAVDTTKIKTVQGNMVFSEDPVSFGVLSGGNYYIFNLLQEMDTPGEWYVDKDTDILYFYPPGEIKENDVLDILTYSELMFDIDDCEYVRFEGLSFKNSLGGIFDITGCDNIQVNGCEFENIQSNAIVFTDCDYSGVLSSNFYNMGSMCISIDCVDWETLNERNCYAVNNYIEKFAQYNTTYHPAIDINYSTGVYVAHNVIHDGSCSGIGFGGHSNIIEFNEIYDVCKTAADMGLLYSYWQYDMAGVIIRYNYLHDASGTGQGGWTPAIYFDELSSGNTAYGNVIDNVNGALLMNGGHRNIFRNNIVLNTPTNVETPMSLYSHAYNWGDWERKESWRALFPVQSDAYKEKYPELFHVNENNYYLLPYNCWFDNNVFYNGMYFLFDDASKKVITIENNIEYKEGEDIGFVDMDNKDYTLKEDSIVYRDIPGFTPIPFGDIGMYIDKYRTAIE